MSKELTEKWKNGKLTFGKMYWCCDKEKNIAKLVNINSKFFEWDIATEVTKDVKEVLAPVPNYEEYNDLYDSNKQLMAHIKTCEQQIERLQEQLESDEMALTESQEIIAELKAQINEANEIIKVTNRLSGNIDLSQLVYEDRRKVDGITMQTESYLEKWGVK